MLTCPNCKNAGLEETRYMSETIDVCASCAGMWFERNELSGLLSTVDNGEDDADFVSQLGMEIKASGRACPECELMMTAYHLLEGFEIEVDVCKSCHGAWIDHEEIEQVKSSPRIREVLSNLNTSVSLKTWLFQFLTQVPVEYNIKPKIFPWVTTSLLALNVLIFCLYIFDQYPMFWVLENFANIPVFTANGEQLYTLLTATFLHGGWMHLIGNMYFLYVIGDNIEDVLGAKKYLLIYLGMGIFASAVSTLLDMQSEIPRVGASGAIAGLFALYLLWFRNARITFMFVVWQKKLSPPVYFSIWLAINIFGVLSGEQGIDYWAHLGGFIAGLVIGLVLRKSVMEANPIVAMLGSKSVKVS